MDDRDYTFPDVLHKIPPFQYVHILNTNSQSIKVVEGPKTYMCLEGEKVILGPEKMVVVPPRFYTIIENPVKTDATGKVLFDKHGQAILRHGDAAVRLAQDPFVLYPGERLAHAVKELPVVAPNTALRLLAVRDIENDKGEIIHKAGEEWLEVGPTTYVVQVGARIVHTIKATVLQSNEALRLKARKDFVDKRGNARKAGEEWLLKAEGAYLPDVDEIVLETVKATILTNKNALHLKAKWNFKDSFGKVRKVGDQWLITSEDCDSYIPDINEEIVGQVALTTVTNREWCILHAPVDKTTGKNNWAGKKLIRGEASFFLQPGEKLDGGGIRPVYVLAQDQALLVKVEEAFEDSSEEGKKIRRTPGEKFFVYGPKEFWPPLEVTVERIVPAFIKIDSLGLFYFQPEAFALGAIVFIWLFLWLLKVIIFG